MRFFLELSYRGTAYCGWQRQPNGPTVQQTIEEALSLLLRHPIEIMGCGRTDTGVHASVYFAHFDSDKALPKRFLHAINAILPPDIAIANVHSVSDEAHARFDATRRAYVYFIDLEKNPFAGQMAWPFTQGKKIKTEKLQAVADLLMGYSDFFTFCKSNNDLTNFKVNLTEARWERLENPARLVFHIGADRFLRGMVRLVVGCCVQVAQGKMTLEEIQNALDKQILLSKPLSAPPEGLFLCDVQYPFFQKK